MAILTGVVFGLLATSPLARPHYGMARSHYGMARPLYGQARLPPYQIYKGTEKNVLKERAQPMMERVVPQPQLVMERAGTVDYSDMPDEKRYNSAAYKWLAKLWNSIKQMFGRTYQKTLPKRETGKNKAY